MVQADLVGHSMGGLLARQWTEDSGYLNQKTFEIGDIHKLITLDTPNKGSFLADAGIACLNGSHSIEATGIFNTMNATGYSLTQGAVADLMTKSPAIANINSNPTNAFVHAIVGNYTNYSITIAKEYIETVMELEADRMLNLAFNQNDVTKELQVVLQERRQRTDSNPNQALAEATNAAFFWQHPYGKPIIGFKHHIESYTYDDAVNFYQTWYAPNNAILVISGDISKNTIMPLINKYYGAIEAKKIPNRSLIRAKEPFHNNCSNKVSLRNTKLSQNYWAALYSAPNHSSKDVTTEAALNLLEFILGEESFGRLRKNLVDQQKIAFTANAIYTGYMLEPYNFAIYVSPVNVIDTAITEHLVLAEINNLLNNGVNTEELENAKKQYSIYFRFKHDSITNIADFVGSNLAYNYQLEDIKNWLTILQNVSLKQINDAATLVFDKPPEVVSYAYPIIEN